MPKSGKLILYFIMFCYILTVYCGKTKVSDEDPVFIQAEEEWRAARDESMRSPSSWLTIAGLFWLTEGRHPFGTGADNTIQLPRGSAPDRAGEFIVSDDEVIVLPHEKVPLTIDGVRINEQILKSDGSGRADIIELNDLKMWIIERGNRFALRLRDINDPGYKNYRGLKFYPPQKKYAINADFVPYNTPKKVIVSTVVGTESEMMSPGSINFNLEGQSLVLEAFASGPDPNNLFIVFKDKTSGKSTYEASRFLYAKILEDGSVDLNFNRAHNPPCAYTPYATCPLPPPQNNLPVKIEAGEKKYSKKTHK